MIEELGYCSGIENYSRHFDGRSPGEPPFTLLDFFGDDWLLIIDESHQTIPQIHGMYAGDKSRKKNLIEYGFRLPSAYDNRPLKWEEFYKKMPPSTLFVSATPAQWERENSQHLQEVIIRPTGLIDPHITVKPIQGQIDDLISECQEVKKNKNKALVPTLTKKMAEDLTNYLARHGVDVRYLHSDIDTIERTEIIRQLRAGEFDVLVGINLLREGLDIPEVGFIGILDADKEGFLRDARSLIQIIGRAARNNDAHVTLYADRETDSIKRAMNETARRRTIQLKYNKEHNITPITITKPVKEQEVSIKSTKHLPKSSIPNMIIEIDTAMREAAERLDFEEAIRLRDEKRRLEKEIKANQTS
jgi:excinuclease ABC subunit B